MRGSGAHGRGGCKEKSSCWKGLVEKEPTSRGPGHERQVGKRKLEEPNWPFGEESVVFIPRTEGEFDGAENDMLRSEDCSSCCVKRNLGDWEILRN